MSSQKFPVSEIFSSFQGEGPHQGTSCVFIRFAGCNLKCKWCDSKFTWEPGKIEMEMIDLEEIFEEIKSAKVKHIVITGGEPMLYQEAIQTIREAFPKHFIEVETSGSIKLEIPEETVNQFNISPKLKNSQNDDYKLRMKPKNAIYKFVIQRESDIEEIDIFSVEKEKVWLMPEGTDKESLENIANWLEPLAKKLSYKFTNRLHILKYGNKRKV